MTILARADALGLRAALALPAPARRALAGRPVVIDGVPLADDLQVALRLQKLVMPEIPSVPIPRGRALLRRITVSTGGQPDVGAVRDLEVAGRPARLYTPRAGSDALLLFFHGGAFVYGGLDTHDASCRVLAERAGVQVLAVDYRLAPEHPFPAATDDAVAAHVWVVDHAAELGVDTDRIAVGGDSAGGNLSAVVALAAASAGRPLAFQLLVYPAVENAARDTRSSRIFATGFFLTKEFMRVGTEVYTPDPADRADPRVSPMRAEIPAGLAPAYVCTAGYDPLRDEGEAYARKLEDAGVPVRLRRFGDQIHGFFNILTPGSTSAAAVDEIAAALKAGLA